MIFIKPESKLDSEEDMEQMIICSVSENFNGKID